MGQGNRTRERKKIPTGFCIPAVKRACQTRKGMAMLKPLMIGVVLAALAAPAASAQAAERAGRIDKRLDRAEWTGVIVQGTSADRAEDRYDRFENQVDRRESRRDEAVDLGLRDVVEDRLDRAENVRDRREDRRDKRN